jgi:TolB-like protein
MVAQRLTFGPFVLDTGAGTLSREGQLVPAGYRALRLLITLLERPGEVLSKSDLIDGAWDGNAIEEANLTVQVSALRKLLGQSPDGTDWIVTIPRVGYRFAGPVSHPSVVSDSEAPSSTASTPASGPSIAVLPFANLSDDRQQDYFADGMVEDIITGLSRLRWLFVIARNSTYVYKGEVTDVRQVASDLGVRYVLEGSVRRADDRLRVTSQLVDASTGAQIWAERYDRAVADLFAVQDEITESVVASLEPHLYQAENRRFQSRSPESLDAWGFVMRAMPHIWTWAEAGSEIAVGHLKSALKIEPDYARALSLLAWTYITGAHMGWANFADTLGPALDSAKRAIERDGEDPWGHLALGYVHMLTRQFRPAIDALEETLVLNPNFALGHMILGSAYGFGGAGDQGLHHLAMAMRLSPRDPHQALYQSSNALCQFVNGRYLESVSMNRRAVQLRPRFTSAWRTLAAGAGMAGDRETAATALAETRRLQPDLSADWVERHHPLVRPEDRAIYIEGLRRAGLPTG